jgi:flagellar operon protein
MSLDGVNGLDPVKRAAASAAAAAKKAAGGASFADALNAQLGPLKLSSHAQQRIQRREIAYDEPVAARLEAAVNQAAAKGSRDSLVLVDSTAFVVSVRNRTVITAVPVSAKNDQVFTNVDSAVIGCGPTARASSTPTHPDDTQSTNGPRPDLARGGRTPEGT